MIKYLIFCLLIASLFGENTLIETMVNDPSSVIDGKVNAITGRPCIYEEDLVIQGAEPIRLSRIYIDDELSGYWRIPGDPARIAITVKDYRWIVEEADECPIVYRKEGHAFSIDKERYIRCIPSNLNTGFSNTSRGKISNRTNLRNHSILFEEKRIKEDGKPKNVKIHRADGTVRTYKRVGNTDHDFVLLSEHLPNGNWILYEHEQPLERSKDGKFPYLLTIRTTNGSQTKEYAKARFEYKDRKDRTKGFTVIGSDGQQVEYQFGKKDPLYKPRRLEQVKSSSKPDQTLRYTNFEIQAQKREDRLDLIALPLDWRTSFTYYIQDKENVAGQTIKMEDQAETIFSGPNRVGYRVAFDFRRGRIKTISSPVGTDTQLHNTHSFIYPETHHTSIYDIEGKRTDYYANDSRRLNRIERFSKEEHLQSVECYAWARDEKNSGNLIAKSLLDKDRTVLFCTNYLYDNRGNIREERFLGNLTGQGTPPVLDEQNYPIANGTEMAVKKYVYSDTSPNLLIQEEHPSGLVHTYSYIPGTDLLASQLTYDGYELKFRKFWEYSDGILVREISDDGNTEDPFDFSNVTCRTIREIIPYTGGPYTGLPEIILEKYWENGEEHLLSKTLFRYTKGAKVKEKEVYDSCDKYCYTQLMEYDEKNRLSSETDPSGRKAFYRYDLLGNQIYSKDFSGRIESSIEYDHSNRPFSILKKGEDGICLNSRFSYDGLHQLRIKTDPQGHATSYEYDPLGSCIQTQLPKIPDEKGILIAPTLKKSYDSASREISSTDALGNTTTTTYNAYGKPVRITHPDGATEEYTYNLDGSLKGYTDPNKVITRYITDYLGRVVEKAIYSSRDSLLARETFTFKGNLLHSKTDPEGNITLYTYDGAGRKIAEEFGSERTTFSYDSLGRLHRIQKEDLVQITEYDLLNRAIEERTEAEGVVLRKTQYEYDAAGNQKTITRHIAGQASSEFLKYDSQNRLIEKTDPLNYTEKTSFDDFHIDAYGQKVIQKTHVDALGLQTLETYNSHHKVAKLEKRTNRTLKQEEKIYNPNGALVLQIDDIYNQHGFIGKVRTRWEYDARNRLKTLIEAEGTANSKITAYTYTLTGQLDTVTKPNGVILQYGYNELGFHTSLKSSDRTVSHKMDYNLLGHLIRTDEIERKTDPHGRLLTESFPRHTIENRYDSSGKRIECTIPIADCLIEYRYQGPNLQKVSRNHLSKALLYEHEYLKHDLSGNILEENLIGQKGSISYTIDPLSRKTEIAAPSFNQRILSFDPVGHIRQMRIQDEEITYDYDDLYQLTFESGSFAHTYQFDSLNNRLQTDEETYQINELNQVISHIEYDPNGNPRRDGDTLYTYDALDRLTQIETPAFIQQYTYDSLHRRLSQITIANDTRQIRYFLYDGQSEIGSYDPKRQMQELRILGHAPHAEIGATIAIELQGKVYAPIHDLQGNIATLLSLNSSDKPSTYRYSAFGEEKPARNVLSPWRYSSKRTDETGLVYYGRRYYNPSFGRWLTPDPAGFTDGMNLYAFVQNDPLIHWDEYGLLLLPLSGGILESDRGKSLASTLETMKPLLTHPRFQGSLQAMGGLAEAGFGGGMTYASGGLAAPAGWAVMAHGLDHFFTGVRTAVTGRYSDTATSQLLQKTGMSASTANLIDSGISIGGSVWGGAAIRNTRNFSSVFSLPKTLNTSFEGLQVERNFKPFTKNYYRANLIELTGISPPSNIHAHHVFVQQLEKDFLKKGINIQEPIYMTWWESSSHLSNHKLYNAEWISFMKKNPNASTEQILEKGRIMMDKYGINVNY